MRARWLPSQAQCDDLSGSIGPFLLPETMGSPIVRGFTAKGSPLERLATFSPRPDVDYLPRAIGRQTFRLGDVTAERAVYPFNAYRWQRCADQYVALPAASRQHVDRLLDSTGGLALLGTALPRRLERVHNQLRFVR